MLWVISLLFAISLGGMAYVFAQAVSAGAEAYTGAYSEDTARQFEDIFLFIPPRRIAEAGWAVAGMCFIAVFIVVGDMASAAGVALGLTLGSLAAVLGLHAPRHLFLLLKRRRLRAFNLQLVDTLISMSNALKAGFSITQVFESVVRDGENPIAQEFGVFLQQTRVGVTFSDALRNLDGRVQSPDLTLVIMAIETARKTGGNLTEILEKISATIRERVRIENRIRTLTAQGRLQGIVVGLMPVIIGFLMMAFRPQLMRPFLHSNVGVMIVVLVAVLVLCGALVIRKVVNIDV